MKKQYIVQKYVLADSCKEAIEKSKKLPVHEVYVHNNWFEKMGYEWKEQPKKNLGFKGK